MKVTETIFRLRGFKQFACPVCGQSYWGERQYVACSVECDDKRTLPNTIGWQEVPA